jgi:hypothetical protein
MTPACNALGLHGLVRLFAGRLVRRFELRVRVDEEGRGETLVELVLPGLLPGLRVSERGRGGRGCRGCVMFKVGWSRKRWGNIL